MKGKTIKAVIAKKMTEFYAGYIDMYKQNEQRQREMEEAETKRVSEDEAGVVGTYIGIANVDDDPMSPIPDDVKQKKAEDMKKFWEDNFPKNLTLDQKRDVIKLTSGMHNFISVADKKTRDMKEENIRSLRALDAAQKAANLRTGMPSRFDMSSRREAPGTMLQQRSDAILSQPTKTSTPIKASVPKRPDHDSMLNLLDSITKRDYKHDTSSPSKPINLQEHISKLSPYVPEGNNLWT